jgi:hypothetical protein
MRNGTELASTVKFANPHSLQAFLNSLGKLINRQLSWEIINEGMLQEVSSVQMMMGQSRPVQDGSSSWGRWRTHVWRIYASIPS